MRDRKKSYETFPYRQQGRWVCPYEDRCISPADGAVFSLRLLIVSYVDDNF